MPANEITISRPCLEALRDLDRFGPKGTKWDPCGPLTDYPMTTLCNGKPAKPVSNRWICSAVVLDLLDQFALIDKRTVKEYYYYSVSARGREVLDHAGE